MPLPLRHRTLVSSMELTTRRGWVTVAPVSFHGHQPSPRGSPSPVGLLTGASGVRESISDRHRLSGRLEAGPIPEEGRHGLKAAPPADPPKLPPGKPFPSRQSPKKFDTLHFRPMPAEDGRGVDPGRPERRGPSSEMTSGRLGEGDVHLPHSFPAQILAGPLRAPEFPDDPGGAPALAT